MNMRLFVLASALWLGWWSVVWGHEWYPAACCSEKDCYELEPHEVEWTLDGVRIKSTGEIIPQERVRRDAPDGRIHRCSLLGRRDLATITIGEKPCFWMPEAGL